MGAWVNEENGRMILTLTGDTVVEKDPDLSWYGGDVCCTEYRVEFDESAHTLYLHGMTSWVVEAEELDTAEYAERQLEIDASSLHEELIAAEYKDGVITKLYRNSADYPYTRP